MMRQHVLAVVTVAALLCAHDSTATTINLNFGAVDPPVGGIPAPGVGLPGGLISGFFNNVPLSGMPAGSIIDSTGAFVSGVQATASGWDGLGVGGAGLDLDPKFDTAATTYTDEVARSLFWGGTDSTVTISGLSANTDYAVGIVSASSNIATHDWTINGVQVADDLAEPAGETSVPYFLGTTDGAGDMVVVSNDHQQTVGLIQALVVDTDLSLIIPEPYSASLAIISFLGLTVVRRKR